MFWCLLLWVIMRLCHSSLKYFYVLYNRGYSQQYHLQAETVPSCHQATAFATCSVVAHARRKASARRGKCALI